MPIESFKGNNVRTNLQFILNLRQQRMAEEQAKRQHALDQQRLAFDQEKYGIEQDAAAKAAQLSNLKTLMDINKTRRDLISAAQPQVEAAGQAAAEDVVNVEAENIRPAQAVTGGSPISNDQTLADLVQMLDPNAFQPDAGQLAQIDENRFGALRREFGDLGTLSHGARQALGIGSPGPEALTRGFIGQGANISQAARNEEAKVEAQRLLQRGETLADEQRKRRETEADLSNREIKKEAQRLLQRGETLADEQRKRRETEADLSNREIKKTRAISDHILKLSDEIEVSNDPKEILRKTRERNTLIGREFNRANAGVGEAAYLQRGVFNKTFNLYQGQKRVVDGYEALLSISEDPNSEIGKKFLGFQGTWTELGNFFNESIDDFQTIVLGDINQVLSNTDPETSWDGEAKELLRSRFGFTPDPKTGQVISDADMLSNMAKFMILRSQNPGRMNSEQIKELDALTNVRKGTSASALRRIRSVLTKSMRPALADSKEALRIQGFGGGTQVDFDGNGNILINGRSFRDRIPSIPEVSPGESATGKVEPVPKPDLTEPPEVTIDTLPDAPTDAQLYEAAKRAVGGGE